MAALGMGPARRHPPPPPSVRGVTETSWHQRSSAPSSHSTAPATATVSTLADLIRAATPTSRNVASGEQSFSSRATAAGTSTVGCCPHDGPTGGSVVAMLRAALAAQLEENERQAAALERALSLLAAERHDSSSATLGGAVHAPWDDDGFLVTLAVTRCLLSDAEHEARSLLCRSELLQRESTLRGSNQQRFWNERAALLQFFLGQMSRAMSLMWVITTADRRLAASASLTTSSSYHVRVEPSLLDLEELEELLCELEESRREVIERRESFEYVVAVQHPLREEQLRDSARVLLDSLEAQEEVIAELRGSAARRETRDADLPPLVPQPVTPVKEVRSPAPVLAEEQLSRAELLELVSKLAEQNAELTQLIRTSRADAMAPSGDPSVSQAVQAEASSIHSSSSSPVDPPTGRQQYHVASAETEDQEAAEPRATPPQGLALWPCGGVGQEEQDDEAPVARADHLRVPPHLSSRARYSRPSRSPAEDGTNGAALFLRDAANDLFEESPV